MFKLSRLFLFGLFVPGLYSAANAQSTNKDIVLGTGTTRIVTTVLSADKIRIDITTGQVTLRYDEASAGYLAGIDKGVKILKQGAPDLQRLSCAIQLPSGKSAEAKVISADVTTYDHYAIVPSKGNISRNQHPGDIKRVAGAEYNQNAFYPATPFQLGTVYQIRDHYGQSVAVAPLQYNPITKSLKVYTHIVLEVTFSEPLQKKSAENVEWTELLKRHFINYDLDIPHTAKTRFTAIPGNGQMLIVTPGKYLAALAPFIKWKKQLGIRTRVLNVDTLTGGGSANNIRLFIKKNYAAWNLSYVLLVGDNTDIAPLHSSDYAGPSDIAYGYTAGNDHYPDLMVGRFSAMTAGELQVQLNRTIAYEKTPARNQAWYRYATGVASNEGPGDNNEYDWEHMRNIRSKLMNATGGYTQVAELYDGSHNGMDAAGDPAAADLKTVLNNGTTIMNYCGHGAFDYLVTTGFNNTTVSQLTNDNGAWPFVWGVACVSGDFEDKTCLGEQLLRQSSPVSGRPMGAIAAFFSTINQYWDPPMRAQDAYIDLLTNGADTKQKTLGALTTSGCMDMNDAYDNMGWDMTDAWILFGDPSVKLHTQSPDSLIVTHPATVSQNATQLNLNVTVTGAKAVLYYQDSILSVATATGGTSMHSFPALTAGDTIWVTVSADYHKPYTGYIRVISGPLGVAATEQDHPGPYLYPNPARSSVAIAGLKEPCRYTCYNTAGALVQEGDLSQQGNRIDISRLASGHYFLKISGKEVYKIMPFQVVQ